MASCPFMAISAAIDESNAEKRKDAAGSLKCPFSGRMLNPNPDSRISQHKKPPRDLNVIGEGEEEEREHVEEKKRAISPSGSFNGSLMSASHSQASRSHIGSLASAIRGNLPAGSRFVQCPAMRQPARFKQTPCCTESAQNPDRRTRRTNPASE